MTLSPVVFPAVGIVCDQRFSDSTRRQHRDSAAPLLQSVSTPRCALRWVAHGGEPLDKFQPGNTVPLAPAKGSFIFSQFCFEREGILRRRIVVPPEQNTTATGVSAACEPCCPGGAFFFCLGLTSLWIPLARFPSAWSVTEKIFPNTFCLTCLSPPGWAVMRRAFNSGEAPDGDSES